jgi:hypothetical protein
MCGRPATGISSHRPTPWTGGRNRGARHERNVDRYGVMQRVLGSVSRHEVAAVKEAGTRGQENVIAAPNYAGIAERRGGAAEMVPDQHHVRINMCIAQAANDSLRVVDRLGAIDPNKRVVPAARGRIGASDLTWEGVPAFAPGKIRIKAPRAGQSQPMKGFDQCCRKPKAPAS